MLQIYHGNAKGKTTAAVGLSVRAAGQGLKVLFTQFLKDFTSGEISVLNSTTNIQVYDRYKVEKFVFTMTEAEKQLTQTQMRALFNEVCQKAIEEKFDVLVLDEFLDALNLNLVQQSEFLQFLDSIEHGLEVIITGRNPSEALCEKADYITQTVSIKHPYEKGAAARKGIEY